MHHRSSLITHSYLQAGPCVCTAPSCFHGNRRHEVAENGEYLAQEHRVSFPENSQSPFCAEGLCRWVPLGAAQVNPAQVSTAQGNTLHRRLQEPQSTPTAKKNRWSLIWKQEGTVPTRREMGAHRRRCHSHPHGIFEKGYCSNLRNHLPWAFPPVAAPPLHSFRVSSPGPQLIHTLEPISICVLFFWRCLSVFDGVEEQEGAAFSFGGCIKHSA